MDGKERERKNEGKNERRGNEEKHSKLDSVAAAHDNDRVIKTIKRISEDGGGWVGGEGRLLFFCHAVDMFIQSRPPRVPLNKETRGAPRDGLTV